MEALMKKEQLNALFALYEPLFTQKQIAYFKEYYHEDFSLQEIAERHDVSRNAVHDQLKKVAENLLDYEAKLHLLALQNQRLALIESIEENKDWSLLDVLRKLDE